MSADLKITADVSGLSQLGADVHKLLGTVLDTTAKDVVEQAATAITDGPKTGRQYGTHRASAPGEAPANDEGVLANSIRFSSPDDLTREIEVAAEYAAPLEFGTLDGKIAARPFLGPKIENAREPFVKAVAAVVKKAGG